MSKKLDEAIEALLSISHTARCWASKLEGDAAEFMRRIKAEEDKGVKVSRTGARSILKDVWGVDIGEDGFRSHLLGRCSCD